MASCKTGQALRESNRGRSPDLDLVRLISLRRSPILRRRNGRLTICHLDNAPGMRLAALHGDDGASPNRASLHPRGNHANAKHLDSVLRRAGALEWCCRECGIDRAVTTDDELAASAFAQKTAHRIASSAGDGVASHAIGFV